MPETMLAAALSRPDFTPRQPRTERKTPRQVRDLPRGVDLPACLTGQCGNQAPPRPRLLNINYLEPMGQATDERWSFRPVVTRPALADTEPGSNGMRLRVQDPLYAFFVIAATYALRCRRSAQAIETRTRFQPRVANSRPSFENSRWMARLDYRGAKSRTAASMPSGP